jgi:hypothetical protein
VDGNGASSVLYSAHFVTSPGLIVWYRFFRAKREFAQVQVGERKIRVKEASNPDL